MNYRSVGQLDSDLRKWLERLPNDIEVIVGIPRSGLLVATLLGLHRNMPVTTVEGLMQGQLIRGGERCLSSLQNDYLTKPRKILVVDDSLLSGDQITKVKRLLMNCPIKHDFNFGVAYLEPGKEHHVDYFAKILPSPRVFAWNVMHHGILPNSCVDIDGVLCRDPSRDENDDGDVYNGFLESVLPRVVPAQKIGWLVTCRLEKYRKITEMWLERHGIRYNNLIMMNLPTKAARLASGSHASYKASIFKNLPNARLFIESSVRQAVTIARISGKYVLCTDTMQMFEPGAIQIAYHRSQKAFSMLTRDPFEFANKVFKRFRRVSLLL